MLNDTQQSTAATEFEQILELGAVPTTGKLSNEDNINSNVMNNGPSPPFIAFQENMAKKTDSNSVTGKFINLLQKVPDLRKWIVPQPYA
jgi:hypothetical protein